MIRINRDTVTALVLIVFTTVAFWQTFLIKVRDDGVMHATVWPRAIIAVLAVLCVVYLMQSLRPQEDATATTRQAGITGWLSYYANPIWCFALYFLFLLTLPWLGMLIGGVLLVFLLLSVLGGWSADKLVLHAVIAITTIGSMWAIFTYLLRVILPEGEILPLILPR